MVKISKQHIEPFVRRVSHLGDKETEQLSIILSGCLKAEKIRISRIAANMPGSIEGNYKAVQRFCNRIGADDMEMMLWRAAPNEFDFVIIDPTEIERPEAEKTEYVGRLKDGKTKGYSALIVSVPYKGRAIPIGYTTYSSKTIEQEVSSRNAEQMHLIMRLKEMIGDAAVVADREFSGEWFFECLQEEGMKYVVRLKDLRAIRQGKGKRAEAVDLTILPGEKKIWTGVYYKGNLLVNVAGHWDNRFKKPMYVITNMDGTSGLQIYRQRMKIEESFRDMKDILGIDKNMSKKEDMMRKLIGMALLAYVIAFFSRGSAKRAMYQE
jgi:hypothetical protein